MSSPATLLVIEDDAQISRFLHSSLKAAGYRVLCRDSADTGLEAFHEYHPDALLLDLGLPDRDGVEVIRTLRTFSDIPVIVLSARDSEAQKVLALDAGADDYLTKPFSVNELLARVRVTLRHLSQMPLRDRVFTLDTLRIDLGRHRVQIKGQDIHLTPIEYRILAVLAQSPGKVFTHRQILSAVWGPEFVEHTHYLRIHMGKLRSKLEAVPAEPRFLVTETGVGYRLADS